MEATAFAVMGPCRNTASGWQMFGKLVYHMEDTWPGASPKPSTQIRPITVDYFNIPSHSYLAHWISQVLIQKSRRVNQKSQHFKRFRRFHKSTRRRSAVQSFCRVASTYDRPSDAVHRSPLILHYHPPHSLFVTFIHEYLPEKSIFRPTQLDRSCDDV